jgi:hypothetical protein
MDTAGSGVRLEGLVEAEARNAKELLKVLERSFAKRTVAAHSKNQESSRSHLIFTIRVESVNRNTGETLTGKITLCDLAGSERLKESGSTGTQQREAIEINKSLTALRDVIAAVSKNHQQVPYRNHVLTKMLQDAIGGTAKTLMIVNCSPETSSAAETETSLKCAARMGTIINRVD